MKPILSEADFRKMLKNGPQSGGYLFFGDEDYLKAHALRTVRAAVCAEPAFAIFNDIRLDALDFTAVKLQDALLAPPMMSECKVVSLSGLDFNTMRSGDLDSLCRVLETPDIFAGNVFVLYVGAGALDIGYSLKRPSALLTRLATTLTPVQFARTTPAKLMGWLARHMEHNGVSADAAVCRKLMEVCGHDMFTLSAETDKLCFYTLAQGRTAARAEDVDVVCCAATEYDAFAFAGAMMEGRYQDALAILSLLKFRRTDPIVILSEIVRVFCDMLAVKAMTANGTPVAVAASSLKMHEYKAGLYAKAAAGLSFERLQRAVDLCTQADMALKASPEGYMAIEKLICSL